MDNLSGKELDKASLMRELAVHWQMQRSLANQSAGTALGKVVQTQEDGTSAMRHEWQDQSMSVFCPK